LAVFHDRLNQLVFVNISREILSTLAYFDLFDYPLTRNEIYRYLQRPFTIKEYEVGLGNLLNEMLVYRIGDFYSLHNDTALAQRRKNGNVYAKELIKKADSISAYISRFPFVEGVAVSGSLSKNFADLNADIDFFIITKRGRLWVARTFLHLYKKLSYLTGKQHLLCMNYFIDEDALSIKEKNIYTATELVTLMPMHGISSFEKLYQANSWTSLFLPNNYMRINNSKAIEKPFFSRLLQKIFNLKPGNYIDSLLMRLTIMSWKRKTKLKKKNSHGFVLSLDAGKHYAKPDPFKFQQKMLDAYSFKIAHLSALYEEEMQSIEGL
jgi:hypothetical protein